MRFFLNDYSLDKDMLVHYDQYFLKYYMLQIFITLLEFWCWTSKTIFRLNGVLIDVLYIHD